MPSSRFSEIKSKKNIRSGIFRLERQSDMGLLIRGSVTPGGFADRFGATFLGRTREEGFDMRDDDFAPSKAAEPNQGLILVLH
jgi:hypothetical protein